MNQKAHLELKTGQVINWKHEKTPLSIEVTDPKVVEVRPNAHSPGIHHVIGLSPGTVALLVQVSETEKVDRIIANVTPVGADDAPPPQITPPAVGIVGPGTLQVGQKAQYSVTVSGGDYDRITGFAWSCGAKGSGNVAVVDAAGRPEGLIQVCCSVDVEKSSADGGSAFRVAVGSIQVQIEEPD